MNSLATHENLGRTAAGTEKASKQISKIFKIFCSPTAECYGVFAQYRFRCVLGELGRFREPVPGTDSGNRFWEPVLGDRFSGSGSDRFFGSKVLVQLRARGFEGFGVSWVPRG